MDNPIGVLKIRIKRGLNLAVRDSKASDPYVVIKTDKLRVKTRFVKKDCNPEWDEEFDFPIYDPELPVRVKVYDHDTFTLDDKMGYAEIDVKPILEALNMTKENHHPSGTVLTTIQPIRTNFLAEESNIMWENNKIFQEMCLRLRMVERGLVELEVTWINNPDPGSNT
ncbi:protein C2-DOMAIN ABA-RELATED 3 [Lactuca sativa]|uniref:C2 domain-containing protein n=2 Tax=Lactuca TaxID=4235 RepID=A0AA35VKV6_LACSI|nr:protein C2-DOMAIN ABA-RELATED 3 [Lactuca sativa]CAI9270654.1 unnamed protein product [Lactuca saligna]